MKYAYVKTKQYGSFIEFLNDNDISFDDKVDFIHQDLQEGGVSLEMFKEFIEHTKITQPVHKLRVCCNKVICSCNNRL